jgi:hypothetical protein
MISKYNKITDTVNTAISMEDLLNLIKTGGPHKTMIQEIRTEKNTTKQAELKKQLPAVTISGLFEGGRNEKSLKKHSGFIQIDIDKITSLNENMEKLKNDPYSYAVFLSPSGNGIKIIVPISKDKNLHKKTFEQLQTYYSDKYNIAIDKQCKDIPRLMYLSWDEHIYVNQNASIFEYKEIKEDLKYENCLRLINTTEKFTEGNRNDYIFKLAIYCNKSSVSKSYVIERIIQDFASETFSRQEIKTTVESAYKNDKSNYLSKIQKIEQFINEHFEIRCNSVNYIIEYRPINSKESYKQLNENNLWRFLESNGLKININTLLTILNSDFVEKYDPFVHYFENLQKYEPLTENDHIDKLCSYINTTDNERFKVQFRKMLVRCIACAIDPKVFNKQVFVFMGEKQNTGKSTLCRWLCPPELAEYISEYVNHDKDGFIALTTNFIINLDELSNLTRQEQNQFKSFVSMERVNMRPPYGRKAVMMIRRANFIGSTNNDEFLIDETGNVRWICFELESINFEYKNDIDINRVWSQAYYLYKNGFHYQLTKDELAANEKVNSIFLISTFEAGLISDHFLPGTKENGQFYTPSQILIYLNNISLGQKCNIKSIGKALKILGHKKQSKYCQIKKYTEKGYFLINIS